MPVIFALVFVQVFCLLSPLYAYIEDQLTPTYNYLKTIQLTQNTSGIKRIDCIYVINLDHRPEKWDLTKREFNKRHCFPNRVSAFHGWELTELDKQLLKGPYLNSPRQPGHVEIKDGAIGCLLSHVAIYKDAYERGFSNIWICEDDIRFKGDIEQIPKFIKELELLDPDWDILYTDHITHGATVQQPRPHQPPFMPILKKPILGSKSLYKIHGRHQTHSMIFSRRGIKKALDYFTHTYIYSPVDIDLHYIPNIREYSVKKNIVTYRKDNNVSDTEFKK